MKRKNCVTKKLTSCFLAVSMLVGTLFAVPQQAEAATLPTEVVYENKDENNVPYDITKYWSTETKTAPVKEGYVFGGWYTGQTENDYMTAAKAAEATSETTVYAKFVPAAVLSIKAQNEAKTDANTSTTYLRLMSSVDNKQYQRVGFTIMLNNKKLLYKNDENGNPTTDPCETADVYTGLMENGQEKTANAIFGGASQYVSVWTVEDIGNVNFKKIIYVRPYWITPDGTKVEGLAKYVHIEDEYNDYISVPVNLMTGEAIAAGMMNMTYDKELTFVDFEAGRVLPEMSYSHDVTNKIIKMVGNTNQDVNTNVSADGIYANIRFKKPTATTNFDITALDFCDWAENPVEITKAWDLKYEVTTTTVE